MPIYYSIRPYVNRLLLGESLKKCSFCRYSFSDNFDYNKIAIVRTNWIYGSYKHSSFIWKKNQMYSLKWNILSVDKVKEYSQIITLQIRGGHYKGFGSKYRQAIQKEDFLFLRSNKNYLSAHLCCKLSIHFIVWIRQSFREFLPSLHKKRSPIFLEVATTYLNLIQKNNILSWHHCNLLLDFNTYHCHCEYFLLMRQNICNHYNMHLSYRLCTPELLHVRPSRTLSDVWIKA